MVTVYHIRHFRNCLYPKEMSGRRLLPLSPDDEGIVECMKRRILKQLSTLDNILQIKNFLLMDTDLVLVTG
jgi:hypothetical protein